MLSIHYAHLHNDTLPYARVETHNLFTALSCFTYVEAYNLLSLWYEHFSTFLSLRVHCLTRIEACILFRVVSRLPKSVDCRKRPGVSACRMLPIARAPLLYGWRPGSY